MKKTIMDYNLKGKKVIIRCDYNVPMDGDVIADDTRIKESLPTIKYACKEGAKVIILSHMGRIKCDMDKEKYSLKPVAEHLSELLKKKVTFIPSSSGKEVEEAIKHLRMKSILLLENTRFEDLDENKESSNDNDLGKYWASLGDIYINDAFGTLHRKNASTYALAQNLPSGVGFLVEKEIKMLSKLNKPKKPYTVVLGGNKVEDKIGIINHLASKCDYVLIGGAMAFTFLKASGFETGANEVCKDTIDECVSMLSKYEKKIILPIDVITETGEEKFINEIDDDDVCYDIGTNTREIFKNYIDKSSTIFWNGPLGYFEDEKYKEGTLYVLEAMASNKDAYTVIGGGDTASAAVNMGYKDKFSHISTGGGASLEYLEGVRLPALQVIDEK